MRLSFLRSPDTYALSIGKSTGIYDDLVKYPGPENANLIMDYAVYSIVTKSNAAKGTRKR